MTKKTPHQELQDYLAHASDKLDAYKKECLALEHSILKALLSILGWPEQDLRVAKATYDDALLDDKGHWTMVLQVVLNDGSMDVTKMYSWKLYRERGEWRLTYEGSTQPSLLSQETLIKDCEPLAKYIFNDVKLALSEKYQESRWAKESDH